MQGDAAEPAWVHGHAHEPNPVPPTPDPTLILQRVDGSTATISLDDLGRLPQATAQDCFIVSTGHGTSGPFTFGGVRLADLLAAYDAHPRAYVDVISADGFGNRVDAAELPGDAARPILLATHCDGQAMTRAQGVVRLIVPQETDDALRQVKWVARIQVH